MQMTQTKCGLASIYNLKFIYQMEDSKLLTIVASHTHIDYNHIENTILIKKILFLLVRTNTVSILFEDATFFMGLVVIEQCIP